MRSTATDRDRPRQIARSRPPSCGIRAQCGTHARPAQRSDRSSRRAARRPLTDDARVVEVARLRDELGLLAVEITRHAAGTPPLVVGHGNAPNSGRGGEARQSRADKCRRRPGGRSLLPLALPRPASQPPWLSSFDPPMILVAAISGRIGFCVGNGRARSLYAKRFVSNCGINYFVQIFTETLQPTSMVK
jgi:hypothetical protein